MSKIVVKEGMQLRCPGSFAGGETCGAWLATARKDVVGGETVIDDPSFFFAAGIWRERGIGLSCPYCGENLDAYFLDAENWRAPKEELDNAKDK